MHASAFVVSANMEHAPNPWTAFRNLWNTFFAHHPKSSLSWMTNSMAITAVVHTFLTNLYLFFGLLFHSLCNVLLEMPVSFCKFADTTCMEPSCLFQNKATCFHCPISNLGSDQGTIKWEKHVKTDITRANYTAPTPTLGRIKLAGPPPKRYFKKVLSIYVHVFLWHNSCPSYLLTGYIFVHVLFLYMLYLRFGKKFLDRPRLSSCTFLGFVLKFFRTFKWKEFNELFSILWLLTLPLARALFTWTLQRTLSICRTRCLSK